jgi:hypothetical protein
MIVIMPARMPIERRCGNPQGPIHAQPLGGFQKWIGRGLSPFVVASPDDLQETPHEIVGGQVTFDGTPG